VPEAHPSHLTAVEVRPSEEPYRLLFERTPQPMWVYAVATLDFLAVNDAAVERYGYSRDEFLSMTIKDIRPRDDVQSLLNDLASPFPTRRGRWRHRMKDGRIIEVEVLSSDLPFDGVPARLVLATDVTERNRAQEASLRLAAIVESSNDAIFGETLDGCITSWNAGAEGMFGYEAGEAIGKNERMLVPPEVTDQVSELLARVGRGERVVSHETLRMRQGGLRIFVSLSTSPIIDEHGHVIGASTIARDNSQHHHAERKLRLALDREREASQRLRALDEMKNTFLNAVSHELRTPLASVLGSALTLERLGAELDEAERQSLVRAIAANARRLQDMLSDLLDLDRLTRGTIAPRLAATEIGSLVRGVVERSELFEGRQVDVDAGAMVLPVDGPKVERIVDNLLANAVRYSPPGSPLWVGVTRVPDGVVLTVDDVGPGVPEELRERIFDPFQQGPNRNPHSPGVGIGLSLVASFAALHGGRAWVEPRPGGGSSFKVLLRDPTAPRPGER
jgi:PAS domain S-box-containing protein